LPDLLTLQELAEETAARAQLAVDFYQQRLLEAEDSQGVSDEMLGVN